MSQAIGEIQAGGLGAEGERCAEARVLDTRAADKLRNNAKHTFNPMR